MDWTVAHPPGSSAHGILQTTILEWVAMPFSRVSSRPGDQTPVSHIAGRFFTTWATKEACCEEMRNYDFRNTSYIYLKPCPNIDSTYSLVTIGIFRDWNTILGWNSRTVEFVGQFGRCLLEVFCVCSMLGLCGEESTVWSLERSRGVAERILNLGSGGQGSILAATQYSVAQGELFNLYEPPLLISKLRGTQTLWL